MDTINSLYIGQAPTSLDIRGSQNSELQLNQISKTTNELFNETKKVKDPCILENKKWSESKETSINTQGVDTAPSKEKINCVLRERAPHLSAGVGTFTSETAPLTNTTLFPSMIQEVSVVSNTLGGTTGAVLVQDRQGRQYIKKEASDASECPLTAEHLEITFHTHRAYAALKVPVPEVHLYKNNAEKSSTVLLSARLRNNVKPLISFIEGDCAPFKDLAELKKAVQAHFVADCLLANWDVIGAEYDNILIDTDTKEVWRIDNGAGLNYRAQGSKKSPAHFTAQIQEFETLRDPAINPTGAKLFGSITDEEIVRQIDALLPLREAFLATIPTALKPLMAARYDDLEKYKEKLKIPGELHNFLKRATKDLSRIPTEELKCGVAAALAHLITIPEYKTTLWIALEELCSQRKAYTPVEVVFWRLKAADALAPSGPFAAFQEILQQEDPLLGTALSPVGSHLFKNQAIALQTKEFNTGEKKLCLDAELTVAGRRALNDFAEMIESQPSQLMSHFPQGFCEGILIEKEKPLTYPGRLASSSGEFWKGCFSADIVNDGMTIQKCLLTVINIKKVGIVSFGNDKQFQSVYRHLSIELEPHLSGAEAQEKLRILFALMGFGVVTSMTRADDIARLKLLTLLRAYYPEVAYAYSNHPDTFRRPIEELRQEIFSKCSHMGAHYQHYFIDHPERIYSQEMIPGAPCWALAGLKEEAQRAGIQGIFTQLTGKPEQRNERLCQMMRSGMLSTQDRLQRGILVRGASSKRDFNYGGSNSVFMRMLTKKMHKQTFDKINLEKKIDLFLLFSLDLIERVGYAYSSDEFGEKQGELYAKRKNVLEVIKNTDVLNNEICFKGRIPADYTIGMVVSNVNEKTTLIDTFRRAGLIQQQSSNLECINGIPLDLFFHIGKLNPDIWSHAELVRQLKFEGRPLHEVKTFTIADRVMDDTTLKAFFEIFPNLEDLRLLTPPKFSLPNSINYLSRITTRDNITELRLNHFNEAQLEVVLNLCQNLTSLNLINCSATNKSIEKMKNLKSLKIQVNNQITVLDPQYLSNLKELYIPDSYFTDKDICDLINLESLCIDSPYITGKAFAKLYNLKSLSCSCPAITDDDIAHLSNLESIVYTHSKIKGKALLKFKNLKDFEGPLTDASLTLEQKYQLAMMKGAKVTEIDLSNTDAHEYILEALLEKFSHLECDITGCPYFTVSIVVSFKQAYPKAKIKWVPKTGLLTKFCHF